MCGCGVTEQTEQITTVGVPTEENRQANVTHVKKTKYVDETAYAGENLTPALFDYPFKKSDNYISNKKLLSWESFDEELYNEYVQSASDFATMLFGSDYLDVEASQDAYAYALTSYFQGENVYYEDSEENLDTNSKDGYARKFISWYIDNKIHAEEEFETSKCLYYMDDDLYYLRAAIHCTITTDSPSASEQLNELCGVEFTSGEPFTLIVEFEFFPNVPQELWCFYVINTTV